MLTMPWIALGSMLLAGAVIILILVWFWRVATGDAPLIKHWWNRLLQQPRMQILLVSFAPQVSFIKARLSPQHFLGLHLTVGILVLALAGLLFGLIADHVVSGDRLTRIDSHIAEWLHMHSTPVLTKCLLILTHLHDPIVLSLIVALITLYLVWKKCWYGILTLLLVVEGGMLINLLAKHFFQRARPTFDEPLVILTTYSFPSGHVAATTLFYGALAAMLISQKPPWHRAIYILTAAFVMVVLVAFSRLYLGAHYLSDVMAAFLEAIAWLALCLTAIHTYRVYHKINS